MTGREVILDTLNYKQLIDFKSRFLKLVRKNYGRDEIPANNETIENYILYAAERIAMPLIIANVIFLTVVIPAFFKAFDFGLIMALLSLTGSGVYILWVCYTTGFSIPTVLNIIRLLFRMRVNKIKSPW